VKITFTAEVENEYQAERLKQRFAMLTSPDWIAIWWHIDDVIGQSKLWNEEEEATVTEEEAREILRLADKYHDCTEGLNWDVLDGWIERFKAQRKAAA
jgi:hypothetical protein